MPQLLPFHFLNQFTFSVFVLIVLVYVFSKYILPAYPLQQVIRVYITKLSSR